MAVGNEPYAFQVVLRDLVDSHLLRGSPLGRPLSSSSKEYGWWVILLPLGIFAGEGGITLIESREFTTVTNALNEVLGEFRDELFGDAEGQEGDHRVTLFQYRKACWRAIWQRARPPWGVLVLDSKDPHINGDGIAREFRDLWKRSLRHMVAEL